MMSQSSVMILQVILMAAIILMSVLGNLLVVASVLCVRSLRQPPNLLLLSLAITDLFVSLVVMPGSVVTNSKIQSNTEYRIHLVLNIYVEY